jgi:hypothetical protein
VISGADQINNFFMNDSETDDVEQKAKMLIKKPTDEKVNFMLIIMECLELVEAKASDGLQSSRPRVPRNLR